MNNMNKAQKMFLAMAIAIFVMVPQVAYARTWTEVNGDEYLSVGKSVSPYEIDINEVPAEVKVALNVSWSVEKVQIPADVVLAIDSSGSMAQTDAKDERKSASRTFVELMEKGDSTKYRVGVVSWDYKIDFSCPLTSNFTNATECIDRVDSEGRFTDYDVGLREAIDMLDAAPGSGSRVIIFLTDGWVDTYNRSLAEEAASKGYRIYTVGLRLEAPADVYLKEIASITKGEYKSAPTPSELEDIYNDIAKEVLYTSGVRDVVVTDTALS